MPVSYDAVLVLSFGGPETSDDVIPFLENVLRGKNVPRERMLEVAEHYYHFGGKSPINDQNRELIAELRDELKQHGPDLRVYWGNRNWHPYLADTLREMRDAGVKRALVFVTSAFSSYSGCRQYREDIAKATAEVEGAPQLDKIRVFFNHPGFIETMVLRLNEAFSKVPEDGRAAARLVFTAHSIPMSMAEGAKYVPQLEEACRLAAEGAGRTSWELAYQSRSGPPTQPWLEPDILARLKELKAEGAENVVVAPIGFISDHMEVLYDLDTEALDLSKQIGLKMFRAGTAGADPRFVRMIRELITERVEGEERVTIGNLAALPDVCAVDCCPAPRRPPAR